MLSSITIRNFRGIKEGTIQDLSNINIFVGRNNTGKSSVLEAFTLLSTALSDNNLFQRNTLAQLLNRRVKRGSASFSSLWYDYRQEKEIEFELSFSNKLNASIHYDRSQVWKVSSPILANNYLLKHGGSGIGFFRSDGAMIAGYYQNPADLSRELSIRNLSAESLFIEQALEYIHNCFIVDSLLVHEFPTIEEFVLRGLLRTRKDKAAIKILNGAYGTDIEHLSYVPDESGTHSLWLMLPSKSVRVDEMGDGFRFALVIISLMLTFNMKISLIEEMENHQHAKAMKYIAKTLVNNSIENNTQLLMTTHNIELIKAFIEASEGILDKLRIFHFDLKEGILEARPVKGVDAKVLGDLGLDLRLLKEYG